MTRVSASSVERQLSCPGSAHLPQAKYSSAAASGGTARHEDAEIAALLGGADDLPWQVRKLLEPGDVLSTECAMAYDASDDTARALGHIAWRDYKDLRPFDIPMTIDLIVYGERRIIVIDYKGYEDVTPAALNPQLATGALAVARASGREEITVAIVYLGANWKPADVATLGPLELDMHATRLRDMLTSSDRSLRVGPWCKYCHAFVASDGQIACPEQRKLTEDADRGSLAVRVESMIPFDRDEDAAAAYELRNRISLLLKRIDAALYARAAERPIPLGGGRMFGRHTKLGHREYDGKLVHEVISRTAGLGREVADKVVEMYASQARFEEVVKPLVKRGKFAATKLAVFNEVDALGGMKRKETTVIEEYEAGPRLVTDDSQTEPAQPKMIDIPF